MATSPLDATRIIPPHTPADTLALQDRINRQLARDAARQREAAFMQKPVTPPDRLMKHIEIQEKHGFNTRPPSARPPSSISQVPPPARPSPPRSSFGGSPLGGNPPPTAVMPPPTAPPLAIPRVAIPPTAASALSFAAKGASRALTVYEIYRNTKEVSDRLQDNYSRIKNNGLYWNEPPQRKRAIEGIPNNYKLVDPNRANERIPFQGGQVICASYSVAVQRLHASGAVSATGTYTVWGKVGGVRIELNQFGGNDCFLQCGGYSNTACVQNSEIRAFGGTDIIWGYRISSISALTNEGKLGTNPPPVPFTPPSRSPQRRNHPSFPYAPPASPNKDGGGGRLGDRNQSRTETSKQGRYQTPAPVPIGSRPGGQQPGLGGNRPQLAPPPQINRRPGGLTVSPPAGNSSSSKQAPPPPVVFRTPAPNDSPAANSTSKQGLNAPPLVLNFPGTTTQTPADTLENPIGKAPQDTTRIPSPKTTQDRTRKPDADQPWRMPKEPTGDKNSDGIPDELEARFGRIEDLLKLIPLLITQAPSTPEFQQGVARGTCSTTAPGGCMANQFDKLGNQNLANSNKLDQLNAALNAADLAGLADVNQKLGVIDNKLGPQLANGGIAGKLTETLDTIKDKFDKLWKATGMDRVVALLTLAATIHNASMLSRELGETLIYTLESILQAAQGWLPDFLKDPDGKPMDLDLDALFKTKIREFITGIVGAENYTALSKQWTKANRILSTAGNMLDAMRSMIYSLTEGTEVIGSWIAKIGNGMQGEGLVSDRTWPWFDESPNFKRNGVLGRYMNQIEDLDNAANSIQQLAEANIEFVQSWTELTKETQDLYKLVNDKSDEKATAEALKDLQSASPPIVPTDLLPAPDPE